LRELARDYDVSHTTLSRYFRRPDVIKQLKRVEQLTRAERRAAEACWRAEQQATRQARAASGREAPYATGPDRGGLADTGSNGSDSGSRAGPDGRPGARPEHARSRRGAADGGILRPAHTYSFTDWLDENDARLPADPGVQLVSENGQTVARTAASNAERMAAALAPHYGPLTIVPLTRLEAPGMSPP
jgi:hypothetical protein